MNIKTFILIAGAGFGIWYAMVGGRQIEEQHVYDLYNRYVSAIDSGDGKTFCDLFSDDVGGQLKGPSRSMSSQETVNKASACSFVDGFLMTKEKLEQSAGQELYTNLEYAIQSIAIAPDKKSATVEVLIEMRIGNERQAYYDRRSTQTDVIQRSFGKARFVQSDGTIRFYR